MELNAIKTKIVSQLTNSEFSRAIKDKLQQSQDNSRSWIAMIQEACFSERREIENMLYDEDNNLYKFVLTADENARMLNLLNEGLQDGVYVNFTLDDGNVIQLYPDKANEIIYAIDNLGNRITFYDASLSEVLSTIPSSINEDRITLQSYLDQLVKSYDVNEVLYAYMSALDAQTTNSLADVQSYVANKIPFVKGEAETLKHTLADIWGNYGAMGVLSYIKDMYSNLTTAHVSSDGDYIEFDHTDYSVKSFTVGSIISTVVQVVGTVVGAIVSAFAPIVGFAIAGVGTLISKAINYYEQNLDPTYCKIDDRSDNRAFAVPVVQIKFARNVCPIEIRDIAMQTKRIVEFKHPGHITDLWYNANDDHVYFESRIDVGWRVDPIDLNLIEFDGFTDDDGYHPYMKIKGKYLTSFDSYYEQIASNPDYYSVDVDFTRTNDSLIRERICKGIRWYMFDYIVHRMIEQCYDQHVQIYPGDDWIGIEYDGSFIDPFSGSVYQNFNFFKDCGMFNILNTPGWQDLVRAIEDFDTFMVEGYGNPGVEVNRIHCRLLSSYMNQISAHSAFYFLRDPNDVLNKTLCRRALLGIVTPYSSENSSYFETNTSTGEITCNYFGSFVASKGSSFITPPSYDRRSLVLAAIITGVILAVTTAVIVAAAVAVKIHIRNKRIEGYANVENKRETLQKALASGDTSEIKAARKDYIRSVKRYNLSTKIFGGSSLNMIDGWQSSESSEAQLSSITSTFEGLSYDAIGFNGEDDDSPKGILSIMDVYSLIKS